MLLANARSTCWSCVHGNGRTKRCMPLRTSVRARKQTEKQDIAPSLDVVGHGGLPADISKLTKLTKSDLRHELEVRGLDHHGDKQEMANRLLNSLIAQESAVAATPTSRDVLEQQLQKEAGQAAASRRGRRGSRTGTTSLDAQAGANQPAVQDSTTADTSADNAEGAKARRGRKPSRRPSSIITDPVAEDMTSLAASEHPQSAMAEVLDAVTSRRGRTSARRPTSTVSNPLEHAEHQALELPTVVGAVQLGNSTAEVDAGNPQPDTVASRRGRRTSRKTQAIDAAPDAASVEAASAVAIEPPVDAAASVQPVGSSADQATKRVRRASRRSSVIEPSTVEGDAAQFLPTSQGDAEQHTVGAAPAIRSARRSSRRTGVVDAAEPNAGAASDAPESPGHGPKRGRRSTASTASTLQDVLAAAEPLPDVSAVSSASASLSRAKQLAQRLAREEISTHPVHKPVDITAATTATATVAAATSSAVTSSAIEASPAAADIGDVCSSADLLNANSQAQSDALLLGATDSMASELVQGAPDAPSSTVTGSLEEVLAQVAAESAAGLVDEVQLHTDDHSPNAPTEHSVELADIAAAGDAAEVVGSLNEAPLQVVQLPDAALDAFDHMVMPPSAGSVEAMACTTADVADASAKQSQHSLVQERLATGTAEQHPTLADIVASAAEASRDGASSPLEEDEEADVVLSAFDSFMTQDVASPHAADMAEQHPTLADIAAAALEGRHSPLEEDEEADVALTAFDHMDYVADCSDKALATQQLPHQLVAGGNGSFGDVAQSHGSSALGMSEEIDVAPAPAVGDANSAALPAFQSIPAPAAAPSGNNGVSGVLQSWWAAILQLFEEWKNALSGK